MRRYWIAFTVALFCTLAANSTVNAATLRWAYPSDVLTLDPHAHSDVSTWFFQANIYETLVRRDKNLNIVPSLAVSWTKVSPTLWRFTLRKGVRFHNGDAFAAKDVVASINRFSDPDLPYHEATKSIKQVREIDDSTVEMELKYPYPLLLNDLTGAYIMDANWLTEHDAVKAGNITTGKVTYASTHANGTGPFKLESFEPETKSVLVANADWWDKPDHNLTRVEFRPIRSDATRVAALLSGEIDIMFPVPGQDLPRIANTPGFKVVEKPSLRTIFFGFDTRDGELHRSSVKGANPLRDVRVRKALYEAIDIDAIRNKIMRGKSRNAGLLIAPEVPGFDEKANERFPFDPDGAKALLVQAGYPEGFSVGFDCPNDRYEKDEEICTAVAAMWAKIGITADLVTQPKATYFPKVYKGETDIYMLGWGTVPTIDGYDALGALLATKGSSNAGGYSNPEIDALITSAAEEPDESKRLATVTKALVLAKEDVAYIPLHQQPQAWAMRDNVNVIQTPDEFFNLRWVTMN